MMLTAVFLLVAAASSIDVEGPTTCPGPVDVVRELGGLGPAQVEGPRRRARLDIVDGGLRVELRDDKGRTLAARRLELGPPCAELATAVAVVLAAWQSELASVVLPLTVGDSAAAARARGRSRRRGLGYDVGAAFVSSLAGTDYAPGAEVEATLTAGTERFAGRLALLGTGTRSRPLGPGRLQWTRFALAAGPSFAVEGRRLLLDLHVEALLGLLVVDGMGFLTNERAFDFDPGVGAGARLALRAGPLWPFVGIFVAGWLRRQQIAVTGITETAEVPRFELGLSIGVAFGNRSALE